VSAAPPARLERLALFAYGSLVNAESAAATLGRVPEPIPASLRGWRRSFTLARDNRRSEKTFAHVVDGSLPDWILSLNVERAAPAAEGPNGALIGVSEAELVRLDLREVRYERHEVTAEVAAPGAQRFDRIVTYVARSERFCARPPAGAVILRSYVDAVERAFAGLGRGELDAYRRTTQAPPVEIVEGELVRDAIPAGNPRAW